MTPYPTHVWSEPFSSPAAHRIRSACLCALLAVLPVTAHATGSGQDASDDPYAPPLDVSPSAARAPVAIAEAKSGAPRAGRVTAEVFGTVIGGAVGFLGGFAVASLLTAPHDDSSPVLYLAALGFVVGAPVGAWGAGELAGGDGSLLWTGAGSVGGLLVARAFAGSGGEWLAPVCFVAGTVIGYETSQRLVPARTRTQLTLLPRADGGLMVLQGGW